MSIPPNFPSLAPKSLPQTYSQNLEKAKKKHHEFKTSQPLKECAKFTKGAAEFVFSPKFSFLIMGLAKAFGPSGGGRLSGFDNAIGALMLMAAPVQEPLHIGGGGAALVGGAVATGVLGVAYGAEVIAEGVKKTVLHMTGPSEAYVQREELTKLFVQRMHERIQEFPIYQRKSYLEHPSLMVMLAVFSLAFRSRGENGEVLKIGDERLTKASIQGQDEIRQGCFEDVYYMKEAIRGLGLSLHDDHAWQTLTKGLQSLATDLQREQLPIDEVHRVESLKFLVAHALNYTDKLNYSPLLKQGGSDGNTT